VQKTLLNPAFRKSARLATTDTAHFTPRPLFRVALAVLAWLMVSGASLLATEPIVTLAMVDYSSAPNYTLSALVESGTGTAPSALTHKSMQSNVSFISKELVSISLALQKPQPTRRSPLSLSRKHPGDTVWTSASLQAGYGEIFCDKKVSVYGRNGTAWEEPACGYLMVHFSF
jgi:hypothetical protein